MIDLNGNVPTWPSKLVDSFVRFVHSAMSASTITPPDEGMDQLRTALGQWLDIDSRRVYISSSVRTSAAVLLARQGTRLVVERPTYRGILKVAERLGLEIKTASWDELKGMRFNSHDVVWITSPSRNPDGASWIGDVESGDARVVQNEIYRPWSPGSSAIPGAIRVGSFSKVAGTGVRIGWVALPGSFADTPMPLWIAPPSPWQLAWAKFITSGGLRELTEDVTRSTRVAREAFLEAYPASDTTLAPNGPYIAMTANDDVDVAPIAAAALAQGVRLAVGSKFLFPSPGVRLAFYGVTPNEARRAARVIWTVSHGALQPAQFR